MKIFNLVRSEFKKNYSLSKMFIIIVFLLISVFLFVDLYKMIATKDNYGEDVTLHKTSEYKQNYYMLSNKPTRTELEEYELLYYQDAIEKYGQLDSTITNDEDYRLEMIDLLLSCTYKNKIIDDIRENGEENFLNNCSIIKEEQNKIGYLIEPDFEYFRLCELYYNGNDIDKIYDEQLRDIEFATKILDGGKYYIYLKELNIKFGLSDLLIQSEVYDQYDYRVFNHRQYQRMENKLEEKIISKDEFENGYESPYGRRYYAPTSQYDSYEKYLNYEKTQRDEAKKNKEILLYSTKNNIKHDIAYYYPEDWSLNQDTYVTAKTCINNIFHLSVIVLIVVAITSGGIVSREHNTGTIKNIITTPVRRWKVLLSKFIYLILHTYIIWFITLFILIIYSGIKFGFEDIFSPKLLYSGGKVIEVNYILYTIKTMLVAGIPLIAFLSILFILSTSTLSTAVTVGVTTILAIMSPIIWILICNTKLYFAKFTPFMYFDSGFIINKSKEYSFFIKNTNMDLTLGIIVSIICIIVLYTITNIIYTKRDIKN